MTRSIAGHTVDYAMERFQLENRVNEADIDRAQKEMYDLLKKALGSPAMVCAQYVTAGYEHFETSYGDEAEDMLIAAPDPRLLSPKLKPTSPKEGLTTGGGPVTDQVPPLGGGKGGSPDQPSEQGQGDPTCEEDPYYCVTELELCEAWGHTDDWKQYCLTAGVNADGAYAPAREPPRLDTSTPSFESSSGEMQGDRPWWERMNVPPTPRRQENNPEQRY